MVSTALCDFKIKLHTEQIVRRMTHKTTHLQWSSYSDHCMTYLCVFMCACMRVCVCVCVCVRARIGVLEVVRKKHWLKCCHVFTYVIIIRRASLLF